MKTTKLFGFVFTAILLLMAGVSNAQLSGNYTVGGSNPDFATLPDVTTALQTQGVSGPVTFNLRAGTYETNGGTERALEIHGVPGASGANIVTFQADAASGATVENTILSRSVGDYSFGEIVHCTIGFLTFRNLTFQYSDTTITGIGGGGLDFRPTAGTQIDSVSILGCHIKAVGTLKMNPGLGFHGRGSAIRIEDNLFDGTGAGLFVAGGTVTPYTEVDIINNTFRRMEAYFRVGSPAGTTISLDQCFQYNIIGNDIDNEWVNTNLTGIFVREGGNGNISGNRIRNVPYHAYPFSRYFGIYVISTLSGLPVTISNNMISNIMKNCWGMYLLGTNFKVYHNTIAFSLTGLVDLLGIKLTNVTNSEFINNMIISQAEGNSYNHILEIDGTSSNNTFESNNFYSEPFYILENGVVYDSLAAWQTAGHGANSRSIMPEFLGAHATDVHLSDCSAGDSTFWGIQLAEVTVDFDGEARDLVHPYMGADEVDSFRPDLFSSINLTATDGGQSMVSGDLDGDGDDDIAVANWDPTTGDVSLFWNDGQGNFSAPQHLAMGTEPTVIKIEDVDRDGNMDLIATTNNAPVIRWGMGGGTFSNIVNMPDPQTLGPVEDIEFVPWSDDHSIWYIVQTHFGIVGVDSGWVSLVFHDNRTFEYATKPHLAPQRAGMNPSDVVTTDLDNDGYIDFVVSDYITNKAITFMNLGFGSEWLGYTNAQVISTPNDYGSAPYHATMTAGDLDGDSFNDILIGNWVPPGVDSLVWLKNDGSGQFNIERIGLDSRRTTQSFSLFDYDGDGDLDIITGTVEGDMVLYLNNGSGDFELLQLCQTSNYGETDLTMLTGQFNDDLYPDVAVLTANYFGTMLNHNYIVGIQDDSPKDVITPQQYRLAQNYPNPFNPSTTIRFELPANAQVDLRVYNLLGQEVAVLINNEELSSGVYKYSFNASHLSSGVYFYRIITKDFVQTKKMVLLR